jgi:hypothetical protein
VNPKLERYADLLSRFTGDQLGAGDFEKQFLTLYKNDASRWSDAEFDVLDSLFAAVDAYTPDPSLRDEGDLDENQLRDAARRALAALRSLPASAR